MQLRRVVITGLGALTPLGNSVDELWDGLLKGVSGAAPITRFDAEKFKTKFACEVKGFDALEHFDRKEARKYDRYAQFAMVASDQAIADTRVLIAVVQEDAVTSMVTDGDAVKKNLVNATSNKAMTTALVAC